MPLNVGAHVAGEPHHAAQDATPPQDVVRVTDVPHQAAVNTEQSQSAALVAAQPHHAAPDTVQPRNTVVVDAERQNVDMQIVGAHDAQQEDDDVMTEDIAEILVPISYEVPVLPAELFTYYAVHHHWAGHAAQNDAHGTVGSPPLTTGAQVGASAQNVDAPPASAVLNTPSNEHVAAADNNTPAQGAAEDNGNESASVAAAAHAATQAVRASIENRIEAGPAGSSAQDAAQRLAATSVQDAMRLATMAFNELQKRTSEAKA